MSSPWNQLMQVDLATMRFAMVPRKGSADTAEHSAFATASNRSEPGAANVNL